MISLTNKPHFLFGFLSSTTHPPKHDDLNAWSIESRSSLKKKNLRAVDEKLVLSDEK